jgi:hypothetical protein
MVSGRNTILPSIDCYSYRPLRYTEQYKSLLLTSSSVAERQDLDLYQAVVRTASNCGEEYIDEGSVVDRAYIAYVQSAKELANELGTQATLGFASKPGGVSHMGQTGGAAAIKLNYEKWIASSARIGASSGNRKITGDYSYVMNE